MSTFPVGITSAANFALVDVYMTTDEGYPFIDRDIEKSDPLSGAHVAFPLAAAI